jgi:transcriptional regulator with XRE-family HTH domain
MKWNSSYSEPEVAHRENMGDTIRLGTVLKSILKSRGLSLKQVSVQTKIPYSTLHTWLENRQPKDIVKVKRLAVYLRVDLDFLLFGESESKPFESNLKLPERENLVGVFEITIRRKGEL